MKTILFFLIRSIFLLVIPFICLIRGAVFFHQSHEWAPWPALLGGIGITVGLLMLYFSFIYGKITGRLGNARSFKMRLGIALLMVIGYSGYALVYLSESNVKSTKIKDTYSSLHPILRLSISTILFVDQTLILTDSKRLPEDYKKMGLKKKNHSLHYVQGNGYVHAVDIRTNNRHELRNGLLKLYFRLMGLNTLRHVGTADHLHVSLSNVDRVGAI